MGSNFLGETEPAINENNSRPSPKPAVTPSKRKSTKTRQAPKAPILNKQNSSVHLKKGGTANNEINMGDIFTKVTIPRSGSFLNAGGLTRYKSKSRKYEMKNLAPKKMKL